MKLDREADWDLWSHDNETLGIYVTNFITGSDLDPNNKMEYIDKLTFVVDWTFSRSIVKMLEWVQAQIINS